MLGNLVTNLIKKYLSPYIEDFNADQLSIFGWSGKFTLSNVYIKREALDSLRLPFKVSLGFIGKIDASVPWMNLYTEPITIKLDDILILVVPNSDVPYDEKEQEEYEWRIKKSYLDNIEEVKMRIEQDASNAKPADDGFFVKLSVSAIKNIQIYISSLHICYEDFSSSRQPFQIGLTLSNLTFETDDESEIDHLEGIIYKKIMLERFSFYINFQKFEPLSRLSRNDIIEKLRTSILFNILDYILCPIDFSTNARIHRKPEESGYKHPIFDLDMNLGIVPIELDHKQVEALLFLLDSIDRMNRAVQYRKWRPMVPIEKNPAAWWKFAFNAIAETGTRRRKREFSWDHIELACKRRKRYFELYKKKLLGENVDKELEELERALNLVVIVMARADAELATKKILSERQSENAGSGWFSGWWSTKKDAGKKDKNAVEEEIEVLKKEFTEGEEKKKLYQAIGYDENALSIIYPPGYTAYKLDFMIERFNVTIKNGSQRIMVSTLSNFNLKLQSRPNNANIEMKCVVDCVKITGANNISLVKSTVQDEFMVLILDKNPLDKQSDFSISLQMKSLHFIYDTSTLNQVVKLFTPSEEINLNKLQSYTQYKLDNLRLTTYSQVQQALESHKQVKIDMKIEPSFIIVPKKADIARAKVLLLVSLGELVVHSKLVPKSNARMSNNSVLREEIKEMIYEKYMLQIKNIQVVLSDRKHWKNDLEELNTERHILYPMELVANFSQSIIDKDARFPKIVFEGNIPYIELKASNTQISQLLILLTTLPFGPTIENVGNDVTDRSFKSANTLKSTKSVYKSTVPKFVSSFTDEVISAMNYAAKSANKVVATIKAEAELVDGPIQGQIIAYKEIDFDFKLDNLNITLYITDRQESSVFTRFVLDKLWIYGETLSDQTLWVTCTVNELRIDDIRPERDPKGIHTILCKSNVAQDSDNLKDKFMLSVYMARRVTETIVIFNMSGFSMILATHYLIFLVDIAQKTFTFEDKEVRFSTDDLGLKNMSVQTLQAISSVSKTKEANKLTIECHLNKMEVIMLEFLEDKNSDILVFNCSSKITLAKEGDVMLLVASINRIQMALSVYAEYVESGQLDIYIMAPTDISINGTIRGSTQMIDFTFDDEININISPNMFRIVLNILSEMGRCEVEETKKTDDMNVEPSYLFDVNKIDRSCWYFNCATPAKEALSLLQPPDVEQKSNLIFNFHKIKILLKSGGVEAHPLIKIEITVFAKLVGSQTFDFESTLLADYYNHSVSAWEPLIEPVDNKLFAIHGISQRHKCC